MRHVSALLCLGVWALSPATGAATGQAAPHHEHSAPHGGTLIRLGDEFAHIELVLELETGSIRAYVLDGSAERGVPVAQTALAIDVEPIRGDPFRIGLAAVPNVLTGEVVGNTSEFSGRSARLIGLEDFEGAIRELVVKGHSFRSVHFDFPEGNEHEAHDEKREHGPASPGQEQTDDRSEHAH